MPAGLRHGVERSMGRIGDESETEPGRSPRICKSVESTFKHGGGLPRLRPAHPLPDGARTPPAHGMSLAWQTTKRMSMSGAADR
jgi:hypothetical protein